MSSFFAALLYFYPSSYRQEFGEEMLTVLSQLQQDARTRGILALTVSYARETSGLLRGALREHLQRSLLSKNVPSFAERRFPMRSEFRFPKSTVTFMLLTFAGVFLAIEKAKELQHWIDRDSPLGPGAMDHVAIIPSFFLVLFLVFACAVLGWAVLFLFRRTGLHRLERLDPSTTPHPKATLMS